jgi:hypothetical protein
MTAHLELGQVLGSRDWRKAVQLVQASEQDSDFAAELPRPSSLLTLLAGFSIVSESSPARLLTPNRRIEQLEHC